MASCAKALAPCNFDPPACLYCFINVWFRSTWELPATGCNVATFCIVLSGIHVMCRLHTTHGAESSAACGAMRAVNIRTPDDSLPHLACLEEVHAAVSCESARRRTAVHCFVGKAYLLVGVTTWYMVRRGVYVCTRCVTISFSATCLYKK